MSFKIHFRRLPSTPQMQQPQQQQSTSTPYPQNMAPQYVAVNQNAAVNTLPQQRPQQMIAIQNNAQNQFQQSTGNQVTLDVPCTFT